MPHAHDCPACLRRRDCTARNCTLATIQDDGVHQWVAVDPEPVVCRRCHEEASY